MELNKTAAAKELLMIARELSAYVDSDSWRVMHHLMEGIMEDAEEASSLVGDTANALVHLELSNANAASKAKKMLGVLDAKLEVLEKETKSYRRVIQGISESVEESGNPFGIQGMAERTGGVRLEDNKELVKFVEGFADDNWGVELVSVSVHRDNITISHKEIKGTHPDFNSPTLKRDMIFAARELIDDLEKEGFGIFELDSVSGGHISLVKED